MNTKVLIVDDNEMNLYTSKLLLESWKYKVVTCKSGIEALRTIEETQNQFSIVLLDYQMHNLNGIETAIKIQEIDPHVRIVMYSCDESREVLKKSLTSGVINFIEKDSDPEILKIALDTALIAFNEKHCIYTVERDPTENQKMIESIGLIGQSDAMALVAEKVINYRPIPTHVILLGETGVGKGAIALAIHNGPASKFFAINCAAFVNSHLLESELFGYEKGAFTGADSTKIGLFQAAGTGTVFLDEVDRLSLHAQEKLLRVLRERKIRRVGSNTETDIYCRIICSAKSNFEKKIKDETLLSDFYYRVQVLIIEIPPLRDRVSDIGLLINHIAKKVESRLKIKKNFRSEVIRLFEAYPWPGNIGELESYVERIMIDTKTEIIEARDAQFIFGQKNMKSLDVVTIADLEERQNDEKRTLIARALKDFSQRKAAKRLGIHESTLRSMLVRFGLKV